MLYKARLLYCLTYIHVGHTHKDLNGGNLEVVSDI